MNQRLSDYIVGSDTEVPTLKGKRRYINLDNATSTPPLLSVKDAVDGFMPWYSSVHRGSGTKSRLSTYVYEQSRKIVQDFVGANDKDHVVIFGRNTTDALNKLASRFPFKDGDVVLVSEVEHHSNDLPWRKHADVKYISMTNDGAVDKDSYLMLLNEYKGKIKLVAITGASNVTGHITDIEWFATKAHEFGAQIVIDAAQLAAHRAIDMKSLDDLGHIDYVALAGHKMYAPFGSGALIGRRDIFSVGSPEYVGGGTISYVGLDEVQWADTPDRDEAGSPNVIGAMAMSRAMKTLKEIGFDEIAGHEVEITKYAIDELSKINGVKLYGSVNTDEEMMIAGRSGVIPFSIDVLPANLVAAILGYEWGVAVRSGLFCAHPYLAKLLEKDLRKKEIYKEGYEVMPGMVRASFGLYNTIEDVEIFLEAIRAIVDGQYVEYEFNKKTGVFRPKGFEENFSDYFSM